MKRKISNFIIECEEFADKYAAEESKFRSFDFDIAIEFILVSGYPTSYRFIPSMKNQLSKSRFMKYLPTGFAFRRIREGVLSYMKRKNVWKWFKVVMK